MQCTKCNIPSAMYHVQRTTCMDPEIKVSMSIMYGSRLTAQTQGSQRGIRIQISNRHEYYEIYASPVDDL